MSREQEIAWANDYYDKHWTATNGGRLGAQDLREYAALAVASERAAVVAFLRERASRASAWSAEEYEGKHVVSGDSFADEALVLTFAANALESGAHNERSHK